MAPDTANATGATDSSSDDREAIRRELTPTGALRAGVVVAPALSAVFATFDGETGHYRGTTVDMARALALQLGVTLEIVNFPNSGACTEALESGLIDVSFMPVDDERRKEGCVRSRLLHSREHLSGHGLFGHYQSCGGGQGGCPRRRHRQHDHDTQLGAHSHEDDARAGGVHCRSCRSHADGKSGRACSIPRRVPDAVASIAGRPRSGRRLPVDRHCHRGRARQTIRPVLRKRIHGRGKEIWSRPPGA